MSSRPAVRKNTKKQLKRYHFCAGDNKCLHASCTHLCLPKPAGFTCACPTGFSLVNETSCAEDIEEFLVFTRRNDIRYFFHAAKRILFPGLQSSLCSDLFRNSQNCRLGVFLPQAQSNECNKAGKIAELCRSVIGASASQSVDLGSILLSSHTSDSNKLYSRIFCLTISSRDDVDDKM